MVNLKKAKFSKFFAVVLSMAILFTMATTFVSAKEITDGWVTGDNGAFGSIVDNGDGTKTFKGGLAPQATDPRPGPYSKADVQTAEDLAAGNMKKSVSVYIDPAAMKHAERVVLSYSLNGADGNYKTEYYVVFWKDGDVVHFTDGFTGTPMLTISKAGIYEIEIAYSVKADNDNLYASFKLYKDGKAISRPIVQNITTELGAKKTDIKDSRSFWFVTIEVENGIKVVTPKYMPATDQVDDVTGVTISASKDVLPYNSVLEVKPVEDTTEAFKNIEKALKDKCNKLEVFDISVLAKGEKVQPNGKVSLSVPVPTGFDNSKVGIFRVEDDGTMTELKSEVKTVDGKSSILFETDHFSYYVVAEKTAVVPPATGENSNMTLVLVLSLVLLAGGTLAYRKLKI